MSHRPRSNGQKRYNQHREEDFYLILRMVPVKPERILMVTKIKELVLSLLENGIDESIKFVDVFSRYKVPMPEIVKILEILKKKIKTEYDISHRLFKKSNKAEKNIFLTFYACQNQEEMKMVLFQYIMMDFQGSQKDFLWLELNLKIDEIPKKHNSSANQMQPMTIDTKLNEPPVSSLLSTSLNLSNNDNRGEASVSSESISQNQSTDDESSYFFEANEADDYNDAIFSSWDEEYDFPFNLQ